MATIHKKTWRDYFADVLTGTKQFDLRLADFQIQPGDTLILEEWDEETQQYTGRSIETIVPYVLKTADISFWSPEQINQYGYQVIQLGPADEWKITTTDS